MLAAPLPKSFAAIGDVHGDLVRLEQALDVAAQRKLPAVVFGDIVGGPQDSDCISRLKQEQCLVLRGNHDQWAVERAAKALDSGQLAWLASLPLQACNEQTLAAHTDFMIDGEFIRWKELSASFEVESYLTRNGKWRWLLAGHSHRASMTIRSAEHFEYVSTAKLRNQTVRELHSGQAFIDIGWLQDGVVIFDGLTSRAEFLFWSD